MANDSGSLGARLLIIIYAASLVAIGAYPIRREYGSVVNFLRKEAAELRQSSSVSKWAKFNWTRARLAEPKDSKIVIGGDNVPEKTTAPKKDLDKLTHSDRKQLDDLLSTLN